MSGYEGVGKVHLKFRPARKVRKIGGILFFVLIIFCYAWSQTEFREEYILPLVEKIGIASGSFVEFCFSRNQLDNSSGHTEI